MLARAGCSNVEALNLDFLTTNPNDEKYGRVTHMYVLFPFFSLIGSCPLFFGSFIYLTRDIRLLDPSCSGSGIVNRLDHLVESGALADTSTIHQRSPKKGSFRITNHTTPRYRHRKNQRCAHRAPCEARRIPAPNATPRHEM